MSGVLSSSPAEVKNRYAANESDQVSLREAVSALENLDSPSQLFLKDVMSSVSDIGVASARVRMQDSARGAMSFPYLSFLPVPAADIMKNMRKKDIISILEQLNAAPQNNLKKADLISWAVKFAPGLADKLPEEYDVSCLPCFRSVVKKTYIYLRRKYDWAGYYDENMEYHHFPFGAVPDDWNIHVQPSGEVQCGFQCGYRFPVDEITELLTLHGHNRCLNVFNERWE